MRYSSIRSRTSVTSNYLVFFALSSTLNQLTSFMTNMMSVTSWVILLKKMILSGYNKKTRLIMESFDIDWQDMNNTDAGSDPKFLSVDPPCMDDRAQSINEVIPSDLEITQSTQPNLETDQTSSSSQQTFDNPLFSTYIPEEHCADIVADATVEEVPTSSINKNHPVENVIAALSEGVLTMSRQSVPLPKWKMPIGNTWVLRNTRDDSCVIIRNQARLVVWGFYQHEGIEYEEVFEQVARLKGIRIFLAYASYMNFKVYQMDYPHHVYKLDKALYGLHQAPRAWYETIMDHLLANGHTRGAIDHTLFISREKVDLILFHVYVDDNIFCSTSSVLCKDFEAVMKKKFEMSVMLEMTFFLGLRVKQDPKDSDGEDIDPHLYKYMIGSLMYVCVLDIRRILRLHIFVVKRIFRYLAGKPRLGLWYPKNSEFKLFSYSNSDFVGFNLDKKSTKGGFQYLGYRLISWWLTCVIRGCHVSRMIAKCPVRCRGLDYHTVDLADGSHTVDLAEWYLGFAILVVLGFGKQGKISLRVAMTRAKCDGKNNKLLENFGILAVNEEQVVVDDDNEDDKEEKKQNDDDYNDDDKNKDDDDKDDYDGDVGKGKDVPDKKDDELANDDNGNQPSHN
ncbi:hypothetical protein E3N88_04031 [Mikania micrantha]|uniref:Reverse transcriptase Ty1/copia-type domain-containing protein n=1 Tax=Mikania micrantha TaxID=192012 RepID=A0A5N6PU77_9ASTR|nr:hypothetical protein E3N88_04031 [Mikania micrantha]